RVMIRGALDRSNTHTQYTRLGTRGTLGRIPLISTLRASGCFVYACSSRRAGIHPRSSRGQASPGHAHTSHFTARIKANATLFVESVPMPSTRQPNFALLLCLAWL